MTGTNHHLPLFLYFSRRKGADRVAAQAWPARRGAVSSVPCIPLARRTRDPRPTTLRTAAEISEDAVPLDISQRHVRDLRTYSQPASSSLGVPLQHGGLFGDRLVKPHICTRAGVRSAGAAPIPHLDAGAERADLISNLAFVSQTTCVTLDQILDWWLALPKESQASQKSYEQLVQDVERAVEVLCIIWTRCELELPRTIHCDGHLDVDRERLRQLDSATRDKDAMLRNQVQPGVGLNLRI